MYFHPIKLLSQKVYMYKLSWHNEFVTLEKKIYIEIRLSYSRLLASNMLTTLTLHFALWWHGLIVVIAK